LVPDPGRPDSRTGPVGPGCFPLRRARIVGHALAMPVNFVNAVLVVSDDAPGLAAWYRRVLGVPLRDEQHGGGGEAPHFGCYLNGMHFAVHPTGNYAFAPETGRGGVRLAFDVTDIDGFVAGLPDGEIDWVFKPVDLGWSRMLALRDPDGNMIEVLQMTPRAEPAGREPTA
jgi:catechol 2,3-dioxygenase-like lactoylglutathione lyase family enzyme